MNIQMLNHFIWTTAFRFVMEHGYFLVSNDEGKLTLRKSTGLTTTFIYLAPLLNIQRETIEEELEESMTWMKVYRRNTPSVQHKTVHLYLLTDNVSREVYEHIFDVKQSSVTGRYQAEAWVADLIHGQLHTSVRPLKLDEIEVLQEHIKQQANSPYTGSEEELQRQIDIWHSQMIYQQHRTTTRFRETVNIRKGAPWTMGLAVTNLIIWVLMTIYGGSQNPKTLIQFGAKVNSLIDQGQYWRFVTPMFLHIGGFHLWFNSTALLSLGGRVERLFGSQRFLFIYFMAGVIGTMTSYLFSTAISAGASGAIFGLFGSLLYFARIKPDVFGHTMGPAVWSGLLVNVILGFVIPGIDQAAHMGGLLGGFLAAASIGLPNQQKTIG